MKKLLFSILVLLSVELFGQCSTYTVVTSYTPASCSTCCNGIITASVSGIPGPCAPTSCFSLQPMYTISCPGVWNNLCPGSYTIAIWLDCCLGTCGVNLPFNSTGVNENNNLDTGLSVFPNPVSNTIFISAKPNQSENSEIEIVNYLGQTVLRKRFKKELDVSDLPNGMYFLQLKNPKGQVAMKRLVIAR